MKISILLPFKDEELFLEQCLSSIVEQTESDFEVLMIDDHSKDSSTAIAQRFCEKDKRFKLFKNKDHGVIKSLELAFSHASGDLLTRQDADDLLPKNKYELLKAELLKFGPGHVSTGKVKYFSEQKLGNGFRSYETWLNELCEQNNFKDDMFYECVIASANWLIYKSDFEQLNYFTEVRYPEDYFLVFKFFAHHLKICPVGEITHLWRDHQERASRTNPLYQDQNFFPLKVHFLNVFYPNQKFILWGVGPTGKALAKELQVKNISFTWVGTTKSKLGKDIYGKRVQDAHLHFFPDEVPVLIATRQPGAQAEILGFLAKKTSAPILKF